ncbi:MAG TPA: O-antigen ligase family protein [Polyangiaceae bacterium]|nr:O-antigen ligase family protein [Polyangiaceae bacterium]
MSVVGAALLIIVLFVRPQECVPALEPFKLLYIAIGLGVVGIGIDLATNKLKLGSPQWPVMLMYVAWNVICTIVKVGFEPIAGMTVTLFFPVIYFTIVCYSARTYERYKGLGTAMLFVSLALGGAGIYQGRNEFQCIKISEGEDRSEAHDKSKGEPDGRDCLDSYQCREDRDPKDDYECERPGLFGTFSVANGRARWRGTLSDPNELSVFIGAGLTFMFALYSVMQTKAKNLLIALALGVVFYCVILTGSRGGILVLLAIFGVYFLRKYGLKGLVVAGISGSPVLLLGGRSGEDAEASSLERLGALYDGADFFKQSPIFGLGHNQFIENYFITAHNSYLLSAAELGLPGIILWFALVWSSVKIPWEVAFRPPWGMDPRLYPFSVALITSFAGILVGIFFLSFTYHPMMFVYYGFCGAYYGAVKRTAPHWEVKMTQKDWTWVSVAATATIFVIFIYTRIKGQP